MKKPIYTNDRKAPRMRKAKFSKHVINKNMWKEFRQEFSEYKDFTDVELNKIWAEIAEMIRYETVHNALGVKLGSYTGELKLQYLPNSKFEAVDISTSTELGEKVNFLNLVNRGKVAKIKWERRWAVKFNTWLQYYAFEAHREINVMADKYIDENPDSLRIARNTLGGLSIWRTLKKKYAN